mgnify:CR=1 FL=1
MNSNCFAIQFQQHFSYVCSDIYCQNIPNNGRRSYKNSHVHDVILAMSGRPVVILVHAFMSTLETSRLTYSNILHNQMSAVRLVLVSASK